MESVSIDRAEPRRRADAEDTRRRVLDAAVTTVREVGYYKASSNEIARRAGVTWGSIQHLFGTRDQLMIAVVNDISEAVVRRFAAARIEGGTLEARLAAVLAVMAGHYEQDDHLVQMQILLELAATARTAEDRGAARPPGELFDRVARPLIEQAIGPAAAYHDLVLYVFLTMRGFLTSQVIGRQIAEVPEVKRLMALPGGGADDLLVRSIALLIREEATTRGFDPG